MALEPSPPELPTAKLRRVSAGRYESLDRQIRVVRTDDRWWDIISRNGEPLGVEPTLHDAASEVAYRLSRARST